MRTNDWSIFVDKKINMITINGLAGRDKHGNQLLSCTCDCGKNFIAIATKVKQQKLKSCGCLQRTVVANNFKTHGLTKTRLFRIWSAMKSRCTNSNTNRYEHYGGKGIRVCDEWMKDFKAFYDWSMQNGYSDELSIDRIDNNGNYCPENCRWVTRKIQENNMTRNHLVQYEGKTKTISEWADYFGVNYKYFHEKLKKNDWSIEQLLSNQHIERINKCD